MKIIILHNEKILNDEKWFFVHNDNNFVCAMKISQLSKDIFMDSYDHIVAQKFNVSKKNVENTLCDCVELCL